MSARISLKTALILAGLGAAWMIGADSPIAPAAVAASPPKPMEVEKTITRFKSLPILFSLLRLTGTSCGEN
jgi:hypothetical protein